jgi:hypothetical protein
LREIQLIAVKHGFADRILINLDFLEFEDLYRRLQTIDLGFVYCQPNIKSNSGVLADLIGNGVPCVVNKSPHFNHISVGKYESDNIVSGVKKFYSDRNSLLKMKNEIKNLFLFEDAAKRLIEWFLEERK